MLLINQPHVCWLCAVKVCVHVRMLLPAVWGKFQSRSTKRFNCTNWRRRNKMQTLTHQAAESMTAKHISIKVIDMRCVNLHLHCVCETNLSRSSCHCSVCILCCSHRWRSPASWRRFVHSYVFSQRTDLWLNTHTHTHTNDITFYKHSPVSVWFSGSKTDFFFSFILFFLSHMC